jgi:hypothetical protein
LFLISILVEQLLLNGLAIVSGPHLIEFCDVIAHDIVLPSIDLQSQFFDSLEDLWDATLRFSDAIFRAFDSHLGKLRPAAVVRAVKAAHSMLMHQISRPGFGKTAKIRDWAELFEKDGSIRDPLAVKKSLYFRGVNVRYLPEVLPFALGVFRWESSAAERETETRRLFAEYESLSNQLETMSTRQMDMNKHLTESFRTIERDIRRPDRSFDGFRTSDDLGNVWSGKLLKMYCLFQLSVGFRQGLNDLLQPLLLAFFQQHDWATEGILPIVFWCFDGLLMTTGQFVFLQDVNDSCKRVAAMVRRIFAEVVPAFLVWMKVAAIEKLSWMHLDMAVLFKRTFRDIWDLWIRIVCAPDPKRWLAYLSCAFLLMTFPQLTEMAELSLWDDFPEMLKGLNIAEVAKIALWLYKQVPPGPEDEPEPPDERSFEFFDPQ